jgi:hypothetical protein
MGLSALSNETTKGSRAVAKTTGFQSGFLKKGQQNIAKRGRFVGIVRDMFSQFHPKPVAARDQ